MKFSEAIKKFFQWKQINVSKGTIKGYEFDLRNFCLYMRDPEIECVRIEDITEYFDLMAKLGWKWNGFLTKSIALRKFFEFFNRTGYEVMNYHLIPIPRREYNPPRVATEEEYQKLLRVIPEKTEDHRHIRNLALVNMLWDTGARIGEILSLNIESLNLDKCQAVIKTEKTQGMKPFRQIFWQVKTNENLQRWLKRRAMLAARHNFQDPNAVFVGSARWQLGKRLSNGAVATTLKRYSVKAKIEPLLNAHSFRHRFGISLAKKGANNSVISNLMGHSSLMSSYRYTMLAGVELEEEYRKFNG